MMKKELYAAPAIEVLVMSPESQVLVASAEGMGWDREAPEEGD